MPFHFCADELQAILMALPFLGTAWVAVRRLVARARARARRQP